MVGTVVRTQVPMYLTFDDEEVEFIASTLYDALKRSYDVISMFPEHYGVAPSDLE